MRVVQMQLAIHCFLQRAAFTNLEIAPGEHRQVLVKTVHAEPDMVIQDHRQAAVFGKIDPQRIGDAP